MVSSPGQEGVVGQLAAGGRGLSWVPGTDAAVAQLMPRVAAIPLSGFGVPTGFNVISNSSI
jgi:hypothetical protein